MAVARTCAAECRMRSSSVIFARSSSDLRSFGCSISSGIDYLSREGAKVAKEGEEKPGVRTRPSRRALAALVSLHASLPSPLRGTSYKQKRLGPSVRGVALIHLADER